jgi:hypothetical protein
LSAIVVAFSYVIRHSSKRPSRMSASWSELMPRDSETLPLSRRCAAPMHGKQKRGRQHACATRSHHASTMTLRRPCLERRSTVGQPTRTRTACRSDSRSTTTTATSSRNGIRLEKSARDPELRGLAGLCIGHLARRFRQVSVDAAALVEALVADPDVVAAAPQVLDDRRRSPS